MLLVQFLVLGATAFLFWLARRDLAARAAPTAPADTQELEQLCETLEAIVTDLSGRLERVERQLAQAVPVAEAPIAREKTPSPLRKSPRSKPSVPEGLSPISPALEAPEPDEPASAPQPDEPQAAYDAPVYALLEAGITDPQEIARRTGLSRGEVDLILSLRARQAL